MSLTGFLSRNKRSKQAGESQPALLSFEATSANQAGVGQLAGAFSPAWGGRTLALAGPGTGQINPEPGGDWDPFKGLRNWYDKTRNWVRQHAYSTTTAPLAFQAVGFGIGLAGHVGSAALVSDGMPNVAGGMFYGEVSTGLKAHGLAFSKWRAEGEKVDEDRGLRRFYGLGDGGLSKEERDSLIAVEYAELFPEKTGLQVVGSIPGFNPMENVWASLVATGVALSNTAHSQAKKEGEEGNKQDPASISSSVKEGDGEVERSGSGESAQIAELKEQIAELQRLNESKDALISDQQRTIDALKGHLQQEGVSDSGVENSEGLDLDSEVKADADQAADPEVKADPEVG
ncbi:hypothetical protein, partial [Micromonospora sonneratiae]